MEILYFRRMEKLKAMVFTYAEGIDVSFAEYILEEVYPEIFEYLGWCSWDAFQIRVSEENLLQKCEELKEKQIPVKWAILDDMWADCTDLDTAKYDDFDSMMKIMKASMLNSFEASPKRFPQGLKHCIDEMKKYGLKIGIWHPTTIRIANCSLNTMTALSKMLTAGISPPLMKTISSMTVFISSLRNAEPSF